MKRSKQQNMNVSNIFLVVCFIGIILFFSVTNLKISGSAIWKSICTQPKILSKTTITTAEDIYENNINMQKDWINIYGLSERIMLSTQIENFTVLKDNDGWLHQPLYVDEKHTYDEDIKNLKEIEKISEINGANFVYVQAPDKTTSNTKLPVGYKNQGEKNVNAILKRVSISNIPYIDMRNYIKDISETSRFYKTDHHWTIRTSFRTFQTIIKDLNKRYKLDLDRENKYTNLDFYKKKIYKDTFLGSLGVKAGVYYTGKDDLEIYYPTFNTDYDYYGYTDGTLINKTNGPFANSMIENKILNDKEYYNKYLAFLISADTKEKIVINKVSKNNLKCLLISDSFGRSMLPYLSSCFKETRNIDPQEGRYNLSYKTYIEKYKPDVVIVMFNGHSGYIHIPI